MVDKIDGFLHYVIAPVAFFCAIMLSFLAHDLVSLTISIIGTMTGLFLISKLATTR